MIDQPGLSYGLFHLAVKLNKLYGIVTTGVTFQGLNLDVGHMRYLRWSKTHDQQAWIAYNRMRGQQASALEHATPEAFWIDRTQCRYTDETGTLQNPSLPDCPQAVSAVKAIAIAASQGQKIYTITQKNAAAALPKLSLSRGVAGEIQNVLAAGKEVTVHEKAINAYGFRGFGYTIIDPETGVGGYLIEGKGNGGILVILGFFILGMVYAMLPAILASGVLSQVLPLIVLGIGALLMGFSMLGVINKSACKFGYSLIMGTTTGFFAGYYAAQLKSLIDGSGLISKQIMEVAVSSNTARGLGGLYGYLTGDWVCPQ